MKFPVVIKDGKSTITFTSNEHGTYESGAACMSTLEDMMVRVDSGKASIVEDSVHPEIHTHNDLCGQVNAAQRLNLQRIDWVRNGASITQLTKQDNIMQYPSSQYYNEHVIQYYRHNLKTTGVFGKVN